MWEAVEGSNCAQSEWIDEGVGLRVQVEGGYETEQKDVVWRYYLAGPMMMKLKRGNRMLGCLCSDPLNWYELLTAEVRVAE